MMSLLLAWPESERTTRESSNADWFVARLLYESQTDAAGPVGRASGRRRF